MYFLRRNTRQFEGPLKGEQSFILLRRQGEGADREYTDEQEAFHARTSCKIRAFVVFPTAAEGIFPEWSGSLAHLHLYGVWVKDTKWKVVHNVEKQSDIRV